MIELVEERRQWQRAQFREPVQLRTRDSDNPLGCLAYDISEGGVRFQLFDFIPLNSTISLHLEVGLERSIDLEGDVVWVQKVPHADRYHVGVKFMESEALISSRRVIHQYIHHVELNSKR